MWKEAVLKNASKTDEKVSGSTNGQVVSGSSGDAVVTPNPEEPYDGSASSHNGNVTPNSSILRAAQGDAGEVPPVEFFANYRSARTDGANSVTSTEFTFKSKQTESSWADDDDDFFESVLSHGAGKSRGPAPPAKKTGGWKEVKVSGGNNQRSQGSRRDARKAPSGGNGGRDSNAGGGGSKSQGSSKSVQPESNGRFDALQSWRR